MLPVSDKPRRTALILASGFGLGFIPLAPGTWGSLGGVILYLALARTLSLAGGERWGVGSALFLIALVALILGVSLVGICVAGVVARHARQPDPQVVVIDEVAGQLIVYLPFSSLDWEWLLAGFLLFRVLDIWKLYPARKFESWPDGWGIMADDWVAGAHAAILLTGGRWLLGR